MRPFGFTAKHYLCCILLKIHEIRTSKQRNSHSLQSLTGVYRGLQGNLCNENRDPVMRTGVPCNENRFFSVRITTPGNPWNHYREWVCSAADESNASGKKYRCIISDNGIWFSKSITYQYSREQKHMLLFRKSEFLLFKVLITNMLHKESLGEFPS